MPTLLSYALADMAYVKVKLSLPSTNTAYDDAIIYAINEATEMIERYCDRRFLSTTYTDEEYDATNTDQLVLKQRPVSTLTSLSLRDTVLNENDWSAVDTELYFTDSNAGVIDLNFVASGRWNRYKVTYTAGYTVIPADLAGACAKLAAYIVENPMGGSAVKSKEEGQRKIEYYNVSNANHSQDYGLLEQLSLLGILNSYTNNPILADK